MATAGHLLAQYAADHQHPVNQRLHRICVPAIVASLFGLLWSLPVPAAGAGLPAFVNWATLAMALALGWYLWLAPRLAVGMGLALLGLAALLAALASAPMPLWRPSAAVFVAAWIGQFIGHAYEGRRPSFLRDLRFLLVGPLWVMAALYQRLGLRA